MEMKMVMETKQGFDVEGITYKYYKSFPLSLLSELEEPIKRLGKSVFCSVYGEYKGLPNSDFFSVWFQKDTWKITRAKWNFIIKNRK